MDFLNFTQFQHYVIACYLIVFIGISILTAYIVFNNYKQRKRLKSLEKKIGK